MLAVEDDVVAAGELVAGLVVAGVDDGLVAGELDGDDEDVFDRILLTVVSTSLAVDGVEPVAAGVVVVVVGVVVPTV